MKMLDGFLLFEEHSATWAKSTKKIPNAEGCPTHFLV